VNEPRSHYPQLINPNVSKAPNPQSLPGLHCQLLWVCVHSVFNTHCCVCVCVCVHEWVKCRAQIPDTGHHTLLHVITLSFSCYLDGKIIILSKNMLLPMNFCCTKYELLCLSASVLFGICQTLRQWMLTLQKRLAHQA